MAITHVRIESTDYDVDDLKRKVRETGFTEDQVKSVVQEENKPHYLHKFCVDFALGQMFSGNEPITFESYTDFLAAVLVKIRANHQKLEDLKTEWEGRDGYQSLGTIPQTYIQAVRNLMDTGNPNPGNLRSKHKTCPRKKPVTGPPSFKEYDLTDQQKGRMTDIRADGLIAYYYSTKHTANANSYDYHLICDQNGRPIFRGDSSKAKKIMQVPTRSDTSIQPLEEKKPMTIRIVTPGSTS